MNRLLLKPTEFADMVGVSRSRAYELIGRGEVPSIRIGGSVRVPMEALKAWIEERLTAATVTSER
jgi:excisionase family DNA binding protein